MSGNSASSERPPPEPGLDYETIRNEIDDLDAEIRSDMSRSQIHRASSALTELRRLRNSLNAFIRQWTRDPDSITKPNVLEVRVLLTTYHEMLMEQRSQSARQNARMLSSAYKEASDQVSVFLTVMDVYELRKTDAMMGAGIGVEEVAADTKAMVASRRELITAIEEFHWRAEVTIEAAIEEVS